jgi:GT2 family glycosyltransferase
VKSGPPPFKSPTSFARTLSWRASRAVYRALPIPQEAKRRFKDLVFRRLGFLIRDTATYRIWTETQATPATGRAARSAALPGSPSFGRGAGSDGIFLVGRAVAADDPRFGDSRRTATPTALTAGALLREIVKRRLEGPHAKAFYDEMAEAALREFLASGETLDLPCAAAPRISILLALHNRADLTYLCLGSILRTVDLPVEVIMVDNASTDGTGILLERTRGAKVLRNDENLGFLKAVNQGLGEAAGTHVLLLNNDALLFPGALAAALATLESAGNIGAVGGRIVLPDGRLQEAGSIVWNDGSCLGYGRGGHPDDPAFLYRRDVDYCSGAFLLVRRGLIVELGGFDETFRPAYYEETDLCLRLRESGHRVVYEPDAVILHYEFASAASRDQALELQEINRTKFADKHRDTLRRHCPPDPGNVVVARSAERHGRRLLMLDDRVPRRGLGAGFPRAVDMVRGLVAEGCFVTLFPTMVPNEDPAGLYTDLPREVEIARGGDQRELARFLRERAGYYDTILVSRPNNMETFNALHESERGLVEGLRVIYDAEAIFARRDAAKRAVEGNARSDDTGADPLRRELELGRRAERIVTVSPAEAAEFKKHGYSEVHVLGHQLVTRPSPAAFEQRRGILFVGALQGDHTPNADSVLWFTEAVWPDLSQALPEDAAFIIAGANRSHAVWALDSRRISVRGFVEDLGPLYDSCRLFVVPTRYAAGLPYKAHEAAAHGLPMVTTGLIADQLGWRDGTELLVADRPEDFTRQCLRLYESPALWQELRDSALRRIETECSPEIFRTALSKIVRAGETPRTASL